MANLIEEDVALVLGKKSGSGKVYKSATPDEMDFILGAEADEPHGDTGGEKFAKIPKEEIIVRRSKVQKLVMRGIHKSEIATYLGIHIKTVYSDLNSIKKQIRKNVMQLDFPLFVGETMSFYEEVKQISLRMATDTNEKDKKVRLAALREATNAEDSKHRFLTMAGMYKAINPNKAYSGLHQSDNVSMQDVLLSIEQKLAHIGTDDMSEAFQDAIDVDPEDEGAE